MQLPVSLKHDPVLSAVFEMRFTSGVEGLADILPGLLFAHLQSDYGTMATLPMGEVPRQMRAQMPNFRYTPIKQLSGSQATINFGELSVSIEITRPYPGWARFREMILKVVEHIEATKLIRDLERISLRYTSILPSALNLGSLKAVNLTVDLGGMRVNESGFHLRAETSGQDGTLSVIQITPQSNAKVARGDKAIEMFGLLVDVDCIKINPPQFWGNKQAAVDDLHIAGKSIFFNVLTSETIEKLEPVWK